eukprot:576489-Rhodomonas_salina.1
MSAEHILISRLSRKSQVRFCYLLRARYAIPSTDEAYDPTARVAQVCYQDPQVSLVSGVSIQRARSDMRHRAIKC